jgi:hypothetical protein
MAVKNCCIMTKSSGRALGVAKWKAIIMGRDGPRGSCGKKALNRQIFTVGYLQFVDRKHLHAAQCSIGYGASAVARKLHRRLSMSGIATRLKNGSVKPSEDMAAIYKLGEKYVELAAFLVTSLKIIKLLQMR